MAKYSTQKCVTKVDGIITLRGGFDDGDLIIHVDDAHKTCYIIKHKKDEHGNCYPQNILNEDEFNIVMEK